jgi:serine/threonine protein kinase/Leucine-rich repeat (LRR) protein
MPDAVIHPSAQELTAFGLGRLPDAQAAALASHLETCAECRKAVENLPPDSFLGKVRSAKPASAFVPPPPSSAASALDKVAVPLPPENLPPELAALTKYRFIRELGRGGMGVVYQAEQTLMGRSVAVKVINPTVLAHPHALPRFHAEVKSAARLDHPNIVRAHDAEQVGNLHLLVMEYVEGVNLAELVTQKGPRPIAHACHYARQAALGLQHAFEQGMTHRDIKPQNLMVTQRGVVKVLDFGLARLRSEGTAGSGLTDVGSFVGTPEYVSPEQATDARTADTRADIYSLGCTLYFLLTGRPPFQDDTVVKLVLAQIEKEPQPVHELRPDVPPELWEILKRMLAKDPAQRFQQPLEVAQALVPFIKAGAKVPVANVAAPPLVASSGRGTAMGTDTSRIEGLAKEVKKSSLPAAPASDSPPPSPFEELASPATGVPKPKKAPAAAKDTRPAWYRRPPVLAATGAAVLALGLGAWLLAGVIFKVKTKDGILIVEVNEPNPEVLIDGAKMTLSWDNGGKQAEVSLPPGTHQIEVKKVGFTFRGERMVTLEEGGRRVLTVTLEKVPPASPFDPDRRVAEWVLSCGGTLQVMMGGKEAVIGSPPRVPAEKFTVLEINLNSKRLGAGGLTNLEGLTSLRRLELDAAKQVTDAGLTHLKGLTNLTALSLSRTGVGDAGLTHLENLTNLRELYLFSVPATDTGLAHLSGLTNLRHLNLNATRVTDAGLVHLRGLNGLRHLDLMSTPVTGAGLVQIKGLTDLEVLYLAYSTVGDIGLAHLEGLSHLKVLGLDHTRVSGAGLTHIKGLINLTSLSLAGLNVTDAELPQLHGLKGLQDLNLTKTKVTGEAVAALQKALPKCRIAANAGIAKPSESATQVAPGAATPPPTAPVDEAWLKSVVGLAPDKQVEAVAQKLRDLNPGFDGKLKTKAEDAVVTALQFLTDQVSDLSPVRALMGLRTLQCSGSGPGKGQLADLSPLKDMKLTSLVCGHTRVSDLSPLKGMPLMSLYFWNTPVSDLSPLTGMKLTSLDCRATQVSELSPLKGMPLTSLVCPYTKVSDLSPLKGMPLTWLHCAGTGVSDLLALRGMRLTGLDCRGTKVSDLSPLRGMPLTTLVCPGTRVSDLSPLEDMKLTLLWCDGTQVSDLSPLKGMPLKDLWCNVQPKRDAEILRSIKTLEKINGKPAAQFWEEVDAAAPPPSATVDDAWLKSVARLSPGEQVRAVAQKLRDLNPGFDGNVTPTVQGGAVTGLKFVTDQVTDLSPVRALTGLRTLECPGSGAGKGQLVALSPLKGMKLTSLRCSETQVADLSPLQGMPLTSLACSHTKVSDLAPLRGMPLKNLELFVTPLVADLSPLKGMPLETLVCCWTKVADLSPLRDMKLRSLNIHATRLTPAGLEPLLEMSSLRSVCLGGGKMTGGAMAQLKKLPGLEVLAFLDTRLTDAAFENVKGMNGLRELHLRVAGVTNEALVHLKDLPALRIISIGKGTRVTDAGLEHLAGLKNLAQLDLTGTAVTDEGVAKLRAALPQCNIRK